MPKRFPPGKLSSVHQQVVREFADGTTVELVSGRWKGQYATVVGFTKGLYCISLTQQRGRQVLVPRSRLQK